MLAFALFLLDFLPDRHPPVPFSTPVETVQNWDCADVSCKRLGSCEEACYKLLVCGQAVCDGDNDGIPCENLCHRRCD